MTSQCGDTVALGRMVSSGDQGDVRFPRLVYVLLTDLTGDEGIGAGLDGIGQ